MFRVTLNLSWRIFGVIGDVEIVYGSHLEGLPRSDEFVNVVRKKKLQIK